jgi:hypothetical protein
MATTDVELDKSESVNPKNDVASLQVEYGQPYIVDGYRYVRDQRKKELQYPEAFCTFKEMADTESAIKVSIKDTNNLVLDALDSGNVKPKGDSQASKDAANFLNYCIRNMAVGTWREAMNSACTDIIYGFSLLNIVTEVRKYGKYKDRLVLKKLAPRTQSSVYGWVWDNKNRDIKGFVQKPLILRNRNKGMGEYALYGINFSNLSQGTYYKDSKYVYIPSTKLLHFRFDPVDSNPQGSSPLVACYNPYKEKQLIEKYELRGIAKDLGGAAVVYAPADVITKGQNPKEYPEEALALNTLMDNVVNMQNGESPIVVLGSEADPNTNTKYYDVEFKGIDGGGKQYKTSEVIDQKRKDIHNIFGTAYLLLGQNGHGSNALSSNQQSTHDYHVENNIKWKVDVINNQLLPLLLAKNGIELDYDDMPFFQAGDPSKPDAESLGKLANRLASSGIATYASIKRLYETLGLPTEGLEEIDFRNLKGGSTDEGSGNGTTQKEGSGSDTNDENAS